MRAAVIAWLSVIAMISLATSADAVKLGGMTPTQGFPGVHGLLVQAAVDGDTAKMDQLVRQGADPNYKGAQGYPALFWVMISHSHRGMEKLLQLGADPNTGLPHDSNLVWWAARGNDTDALRILLEHGANSNAPPCECETPLMAAAKAFQIERIDMLLGHGADINGQACGFGAADTAAILGRFDIVLHLLSRGYDANLEGLAIMANDRSVPKDTQVYRDKLRVLEILRQRGVKVPPPKQ
jgi:uncharacterized protein